MSIQRLVKVCLILACLFATTVATASAQDLMKYGVTTDDPWAGQAAQVDALNSLQRTPTLRVVFDEWVAPFEYVQPLKALKPTGYILGEILDSAYMSAYTVTQFKRRVDRYTTKLWQYVDVWEIGNEINGEWLGGTSATVKKMNYAYDRVKALGGKTALTLYYNKDCWDKPQNEMFLWTETNVPERIRTGTDYILVSYYEDDCNGLKPDWNEVFNRLADLFPNSAMAIGETGTTIAGKKEGMVREYYGMAVDHPRFIGGVFWWYFRQDMTPKTKHLWGVLNEEFGTY